MQRIIVFGDSYCSQDPFSLSWPKIISETMEYETINYAIAGSSTEYAILKFKQFIESDELRPDDVIVFQFSSAGRLHFTQQMTHPATAAQYQHEPKFHSPEIDHTWYQLSKEHIKWYLANRDKLLLVLQHTAFLHLLKTFAETHKTNTVVVLQLDLFWYDKTFSVIDYPDNMFHSMVELYHISLEDACGNDYYSFTQHTLGDVRTNHLSLPNRNILAEAVVEIIETRSIENFTYDRFLKNVIQPVKTKKEYYDCINKGLLEYRDLGDHWFSQK